MNRKYVFIVALWLGVLGSFAQQYTFQAANYQIPGGGIDGIFAGHVAVGDFNGDGKNDVVASGVYPNDATSQKFFIYIQNANGSLNPPIEVPFTNPNPGSNGPIAVADMNGDGLDDIVIACGDSLYIYFQTVAHSLVRYPKGIYGGNGIAIFKVGNIDNDEYPDIAVDPINESVIRVLYGTASADSFTALTYPSTQCGAFDDLKLSFTNNRKMALYKLCAVGSNVPPVIETEIDPTRVLANTYTYTTSIQNPTYCDIAVGDRYNNGNQEIYVTDNFNNDMYIWNDPPAVTGTNTTLPLYQSPQAMVMADLDCSGKQEIIIAHGGWSTVSIVLPNDTIETFNFYIGDHVAVDGLVVADVNSDGKPDIIAASIEGGLSILINTTPDLPDSISEASQILAGYDTTIIMHTTDSVLQIQTLFNGNDSVIKTTSMVINDYAIDSFTRIKYTGEIVGLCSGDTTGTYTQIANILSAQSFYNDTLVMITNDTLFPAGTSTLAPAVPALQLYPNPFSNTASVQFNVPVGNWEAGLKNAFIVIYDILGQQKNMYPLTNNTGVLTIKANNLSSGVYLYALVIAGKPLLIKRMVIE